MKCFLPVACCLCLLAVFAAGCGTDGSASVTANAGADQEASEGSTVSLVGSGNGSTFLWSQLSGPTVMLDGADKRTVSFEAPWIVDEATDVELELAVGDGGSTAVDTVTVTITNTHFVLFKTVQTNDGPGELYRAELDGGVDPIKLSRTQATNGGVGDEFSATRNGKHVAYKGDLEEVLRDEVFVVPSTGGTSTKVSGMPSSDFEGVFSPEWSPDGERIAYARRGESIEIFTNFADGTGIARINGPLPDGSNATNASWSPDSRRIAYRAAQDTPNRRGLYTSRPDGSDNSRIHPPLAEFHQVETAFFWSPDASRIAFRSGRVPDRRFDLFISRPDGGDYTQINAPLPEGGTVEFDVRWSPDGSRIAYRVYQGVDDVFDLFTNTPDGTDNVKVNAKLARGSEVRFGYSWSPDGERIAYRAQLEGDRKSNIYTSAPDGTSTTKVNATLGENEAVYEPIWSPDGRRLAYRLLEGMSASLVTSTPDGRDRKTASQSTDGFRLLGAVSWSPDGGRIAYRAREVGSEVWAIYSANPDGTEHAKVSGPTVDGGDGAFRYLWSPDSSRIVYLAQQDDSNVYELYSSRPDGSDNVKLSSGLVGVDAFTAE
ncbi:MAG: hypothetical protein EX268_16695 [Deltaproteobacteria bacterium]|nr:MAG: hypothetical protein EX268_16695 [Deltaproteobacteria bacterium]